MIGGRSFWGSLVEPLLSKYNWTLDYILWGISFVNVQMILSDTVEVFSKNNKDLKDTDTVINADNPANKELVRQLISE